VAYSVSLKGVGKRYIKYDDIPLLVTRALRFRAGNKRTHLWALRNIDLEVQPGESLGVIGRNGSGKSTMFRILAGVTGPTEGKVSVRGRIAPLISVGIGFHPELTGRENVYVNAAILGLTKPEIDRRFDAIVDFSEIEEFIDTPVKFYSSGMFVRLGFSVAVSADPEVLLVDEVLAVGDVAFQLKCFDRMEQIRRSGATVLVVTHSANAIRRLCTRAMLLSEGETVFVGDTGEAIARYFDRLGELELGAPQDAPELQVKNVGVFNANEEPVMHVNAGDEVIIRSEIHFTQPSDGPIVGLSLFRDTGQKVYSDNTIAYRERRPVAAGETIRCDIRLRATLPTGAYLATVTVFLSSSNDSPMSRAVSVNFFVTGRPFVKGVADLGGSFEFGEMKYTKWRAWLGADQTGTARGTEGSDGTSAEAPRAADPSS
jgi:ABC-type polysaccharide/polyol phosphate transport system ATPase subunit